MEPNVGIMERLLRILLGALIFSLPFLGYSGVILTPIFFLLGGYSLLTGIVGFCLIYKMIGYTSNRKNFW